MVIPFPSGTLVVDRVDGSNNFTQVALAIDYLNISGVLPYTKGGTSLSGIGTSNQLLGVNSAGTGLEYKTQSVGTTGSDFNIAQSVSGITFNLPDAGAAARGAITTGTQTVSGAKTFLSNTTFSGNLIFNAARNTLDIAASGVELAHVYTRVVDAGSVGNLVLQAQAGSAQVQLATQSINRWLVREAGDLEPAASNTYKIGSSSAEVSSIVTRQIGTGGASSLLVNISGTQVWSFDTGGNFIPSANNSRTIGDGSHTTNGIYTYQIGTGDNSFDLIFFINSISRWKMDKTNGYFLPNADNAYNIGSTSLHVSATYTYQVGTGNANDLILYTNNTNRWKITSDGNLNPNSDNAYQVGTSSLHAAGVFAYVIGTGNSNDLLIFTNNTTRWRFRAAGTLNPNGNNTYDLGETSNRIATIYAINALNTSDQRVKTDIVTLDSADALNKVNSLNPIRYKFKPEYDTTDRFRTGFKAQEVISLLPEAVMAGDSDLEKEYGDEGFETWSMQVDHIIPYLTAAIKELKSKNDALEARIITLEE